MPRLLKGMKKRGKAHYWRYRKNNKEIWIPLGSDFETACKQLKELKRKGTVHRSDLTLTDLADRWLEIFVPNGRNEKNQKLARTRVERYVRPYFGKRRLDELKPRELRSWRIWLERRPISLHTVRHILGDMRTMLRWAVDEGWLDRSPFPRRLLPRLQEQPPDRLTDEEVGVLLRLDDPHGFVIRLGLGTGMRWSELCRAQASDVNSQGQLVVSQTKSGRVRRVPLSHELLGEIRGRVGRLIPFSEKSPGSFARYVRRRTGVARFHPHQLRHTFGCRWLERGNSLPALQEILGHASIITTQKYARLGDVHVQAEAERLWGKIVGNGA